MTSRQPDSVNGLVAPNRPEGLFGTVLCIACGYFGLGVSHPEWCTWQVLKERPEIHARALAEVEFGRRAANAMDAFPSLGLLPQWMRSHTPGNSLSREINR